MKRWAPGVIAFLLTGACTLAWLRLPLWRDVRFQTGFKDDVVVLPSGHEFRPGTWASWPEDAAKLMAAEPGDYLRQEGRGTAIRIRNRTGDYPAKLTSVKGDGDAKTYFIVAYSKDG